LTREELEALELKEKYGIDGFTGMQPFKGVNTNVKHLQHLTSDELNAPQDKELMAKEWNLLLEEARAKIKPVLKVMSDEELDSLCADINDLRKDK
jgi:hypothetical protein